MLRCVIVDDEKKARENICLLLNAYCPEIEIVAEAHDKKSALVAFKETKPDLVFLDIHLQERLTSFDILEELEEIDFHIIFVTASEKHAIKGYQYDAIDYILKPLKSQRLIAVVNKVKRAKEQNTIASTKTALKEFKELYAKVGETPKIAVADTKDVHVLKINEILYCQSNGNYTTFMLIDGNEIVVSKNLKQFETVLVRHNFFRTHKSYLVNLNQINGLSKEQGLSVRMSNKKLLPVSRNNKKELFALMNVI